MATGKKKMTPRAIARAKVVKAQNDLSRGKIAPKDYRAAAGYGGDRAKKPTRKGAGGKTMS